MIILHPLAHMRRPSVLETVNGCGKTPFPVFFFLEVETHQLQWHWRNALRCSKFAMTENGWATNDICMFVLSIIRWSARLAKMKGLAMPAGASYMHASVAPQIRTANDIALRRLHNHDLIWFDWFLHRSGRSPCKAPVKLLSTLYCAL
jgi:hypothetical protein